MADTNAQLEELTRILEDVNREMALYGRVTKQTADERFDADVKNKMGINNATKGLASLGEGLTAVAGAGMAAGKAMYEGKKGAAAFNDSIDGMAKAAQAAGVALALMIPGGPLIKLFIAGITAAVVATAEYVKAANEMADKLYKGYSNMSQAGAAASDGMTGVYKGAKKLGLSMNELDGYVSLVGESSKDLALLSGSVYEGRKQFENMGEAMEPYRKSMIAAGMSQEMINQGAMGYLKLQTRIGTAQRMTTDQLADGARRYLIEQDALTKLTGTTRKENEAALEEARSQQRFRAKTEAMRASGDAGQIAAADELEKTYQLLRSQSKEAAQGFGDMTTGMIGTEASQKLLMSSNGEALQVANKMVAGQQKAIDGTQQIASAVGRVAKDMNMTYQTGVGEEFLLSIKESADLGLLATKDLNQSYEKISQDQTAQGLKGGEAADKITEQYAKNIKQQQELNKKMEDAVFQGIDNALSLTNKLGNITGGLADAFTKLADATNKLLRILGLGSDNTPEEQAKVDTAKKQDDQNWENANFGEKMQSSVTRGLEKFSRTLGQVTGFKPLENLADTAQQARVESESKYLQQQGKFQQVAPVAPTAGGSGSGGPGSAGGTASQAGLANLGLKLKQGDVQAEGSKIDPRIIELAQQVQASLPTFSYFSGFNDKFHQEKAPGSSHTTGRAMDFALSKHPSKEEGQEIVKWLKSMGASVAIDEYNNPSAKATAGHIHAQIPGYADGGIASTPQIAMVAEKGPEAMIPLVNGAIPLSISLKDAIGGPTFGGMNEYAGYNQGPMSTDLSAVKSIAEAVGAFDKVSQTITDPKMWKDILSSGLATNYQLGATTLGTQGIRGLGDDIAERLKEIKEQTNTDSESALKQVTEEFKSAMATMSQQLAQMAGNQNEGAMGGVASLLQELVTATKNGVTVQERILQTSM